MARAIENAVGPIQNKNAARGDRAAFIQENGRS